VSVLQDSLTQDQMLHDLVVREVAESRFGLDGWDVQTHAGGGSPDIVAMNLCQPVAVGEIETAGTICEERAQQWKEFGKSCVRFYLYVPEGAEEETARLIAKHQVGCAGLRSYSRNGKLTLRSVHLDNVLLEGEDHPWWSEI
jgi:hypothetical protein